MRKKLILGLVAVGAALVMLPLFAAFEAHVINVVAQIENALFVHPISLQFGTVFPQETFFGGFAVDTSESFSAPSQTRVLKIDYEIKQKPKPRDAFEQQVGVEAARDFCESNSPANVGDPNDLYYASCFPVLCPYVSKLPQQGPGDVPADVGVSAFHDITAVATGHLNKTLGIDVSDQWTVDLAVPCFKGQCSQDWPNFVAFHNPSADPDDFMLPAGLESQTFGCDLWVEVTNIF